MNELSPIVSEFATEEEEAAYLRWLEAKVAKSLADPRPPIPHEEAMRRLEARLQERRDARKAC